MILEPRRRIDQALYAVVMEAYVAGVSTRSVDDLSLHSGSTGHLQIGGLAHLRRPGRGGDRLPHEKAGPRRLPYLYLDATYLHVRNSTSQVVSMAVVVATGITTDGGREVLGLDVGDSENEVFWRGFLTALKRRGLSGVRLVISD